MTESDLAPPLSAKAALERADRTRRRLSLLGTAVFALILALACAGAVYGTARISRWGGDALVVGLVVGVVAFILDRLRAHARWARAAESEE